MKKFNHKLNKKLTAISPEVWRVFKDYQWPGNVRELENTLESAVALSSGETLQEEDLPLRLTAKVNNQSRNARNDCGILESQEIVAIKRVLEKHNGHRERAAQELGISRRALQYKLNKFQLRNE